MTLATPSTSSGGSQPNRRNDPDQSWAAGRGRPGRGCGEDGAMFNWEQDPKQTERGAQLLLKRRYPGLQSFDGAGGDGGRDASLITPDGHTVFEVKSFGRLDSTRRRQVERSLKKAVQSAPDMTRWVLVIPMNMTPRRPGAKSSEQSWFEEKLPTLAPGVDLNWYGQDWLDAALAENMDIQRFIEGPDSQVLQRAGEFGMEQAVLADGATDLDARLAGLQRRVDEVSPYWTVDFAVLDGIRMQTLRAKTPNAPVIDPITITPTFAFKAGDAEDQRLRAQFEQTLAFGGRVDLPAGYVTNLDIDASEEARKLFLAGDPSTSEFSFISTREALEHRIRCRYQVLDGGDKDASVLSEFSVFLAERTAGSVGVTLYGSDAAGFAEFEVSLPRPPSFSGGGEVTLLESPRLRFTLQDSLVGFDIDSLLPVVRTLAAATTGTRIRFLLPELGYVDSEELVKPSFLTASATYQLVADLHRMQEVTGAAYTFPANVTNGHVDELRRAVRQLDGEDVDHDGGFVLNLRTESVGAFLATLDKTPEQGRQGGLMMASEFVEIEVGDLQLVYGPSAFWAPHPQLTNRAELEAIAAGTVELPADAKGVPAEFEPTDAPFKWFSRDQSATYLESGEHPSDSGDKVSTTGPASGISASQPMR